MSVYLTNLAMQHEAIELKNSLPFSDLKVFSNENNFSEEESSESEEEEAN